MPDSRDLKPDRNNAPHSAPASLAYAAIDTNEASADRERNDAREDIDAASLAAARPERDGADSNGQQNVEDRPNVSMVKPEDYPEQQ